MQVKSIAECSKHSAIRLAFIKLPFVIKIFILSIFEWPFYTGFTVYSNLWLDLTDVNEATVVSCVIRTFYNFGNNIYLRGAQWLSGRVLDSRPKGRGLEPHRRHCVVVLEQDTFILA